MKKILFCVAAAYLCSTLSLVAQDNVRAFEFEAGFGITNGLKTGKANTTPGLSVFMEARYNFRNSPFDIGLQGCMTNYDKDGASVFLAELNGTSESKHRVNQHVMPRSAVVYSDYNYRKWKHVSLFGGIGLGCAQVVNQVEADEPDYWYRDTWRENFFVFSPRAGVEFFDHIRLTCSYKALSKYSYWGVNLGFAFGGGAKK